MAAPPEIKPVLGRVDPASKLDGTIFSDDDGTVYDVMLNHVDMSTNSDKYYILQLVSISATKFAVFTRWGRTGTAGSCAIKIFTNLNEARSEFATKFDEKTGGDWAHRDTYAHVAGKYLWVQVDHAVKEELWKEDAKWQYWVDDGVDGKRDGWYDYTEDGSSVVEQLFHEWSFNPRLSTRVVASGAWQYEVDLNYMKQTNIVHMAHKSRHIRRWTAALGDDQTPPGELPQVKQEAKWQYWVDDGVDGKQDGWYDFTANGSLIMEQLHREWSLQPRLSTRIVQSGNWQYEVDLNHMKQTNITHSTNTSRHIRRWTAALGDDHTPPGELARKRARIQPKEEEEEEEEEEDYW